MPTYRYLLCDLLTDQPIAEPPLSGVQFTRRISRTGDLSATLTAVNTDTVRAARLLHRYAGRAALYVYRDSAIWWGGIPWSVVPAQDKRGGVVVQVQAATFDSYAHHRRLYANKTYTQVDQGVIIPDLWRTIQLDARGDIGVYADDQPTGIPRDRTYLASEMAYVGKLIEDLGDVIDGPEHTIDVYADEHGNRVKRLRLGQRLGLDEPRAVFQRAVRGGGRVLSWKHASDAVDGGTVFQTRGDSPNGNVGEDVEPLMSQRVEATELLAAGWPLLDVTQDYSGVSESATLDGHAHGLRARQSGAQQISSYTVQTGTTDWSPNRVGDPVRLKLHDLWHDPPVDLTVRPVGCTVRAAEADAPETIDLLFGDD